MRKYIVVSVILVLYSGIPVVFVLGLAHRNVGRVARTIFFEAMFRVRY